MKRRKSSRRIRIIVYTEVSETEPEGRLQLRKKAANVQYACARQQKNNACQVYDCFSQQLPHGIVAPSISILLSVPSGQANVSPSDTSTGIAPGPIVSAALSVAKQAV